MQSNLSFMKPLFLSATLLTASPSFGAAAAASVEDTARQTVLDALAPALAVRGATARISIAQSDLHRTLAACNEMVGFMPPGSRLVGRTLLGVRCVDGANWQAFVAADIRVEGPTWQTTRSIRPGEPLASGDVVRATSQLTAADVDAAVVAGRTRSGASGPQVRGLVSFDGRLPAPVGRIVAQSLTNNRALCLSDVRESGRINPGDPVRVVYLGDGFSVSSEGRSVGAADPGGSLIIRLASGALVNGTLRSDHLVELPR